MKCEKKCKYCGSKIGGGTMYGACRDKLWQIRTIKAMLLGCSLEKVILIEEEKRHK